MSRIFNEVLVSVVGEFGNRISLFDSFRVHEGAVNEGDGHHCVADPSCVATIHIILTALLNINTQ